MRLAEFEIGKPFRCGSRLWRCTDIGSRVVVAIRLDTVETGGSEGSQALGLQEAEAAGWFRGPPYAVAETVFDEDDQESCEPAPAGEKP